MRTCLAGNEASPARGRRPRRRRILPRLGGRGRAAVGGPAPQGTGEAFRTPMGVMRKIIARRMLASHLSVPPVTQLAKADVTELLELRRRMNEALDSRISLNAIVIKATAVALREYPAINVSIGDQLENPYKLLLS